LKNSKSTSQTKKGFVYFFSFIFVSICNLDLLETIDPDVPKKFVERIGLLIGRLELQAKSNSQSHILNEQEVHPHAIAANLLRQKKLMGAAAACVQARRLFFFSQRARNTHTLHVHSAAFR
jgi:hypothetical protein